MFGYSIHFPTDSPDSILQQLIESKVVQESLQTLLREGLVPNEDSVNTSYAQPSPLAAALEMPFTKQEPDAFPPTLTPVSTVMGPGGDAPLLETAWVPPAPQDPDELLRSLVSSYAGPAITTTSAPLADSQVSILQASDVQVEPVISTADLPPRLPNVSMNSASLSPTKQLFGALDVDELLLCINFRPRW